MIAFTSRSISRIARPKSWRWRRPTGMSRTASSLFVGDRAVEIDRENRVGAFRPRQGVAYDAVMLATGSAPFVPPVPGIDKKGVFVYRTIEDLEKIIGYGETVRRRRPSSAAACSAWRRPRRLTTWAWKPMSSSSPRG